MRSLFALGLALVFTVPLASAQDGEFETSFMMFNQHQCSDLGGAMEIADDLQRPILNELRAEGMIQDWGVLTHAWGDEWNFNFYIVADDHASWLSAWQELVRRMNERDSDWFERFGSMCHSHKDNLYTLRTTE